MRKSMMMFMLTLATIFMVVACREDKTAGEKIEDGIEEVGEGIEDGAEEVGDEIEDAVDDN